MFNARATVFADLGCEARVASRVLSPALREGRDLTAKEKTIHTKAIVGVLRTQHDKLDAAVLTHLWLPAAASTDDIPMR